MIKLSKATYAFLAFLFFLLWFPKDWEDRGEALSVWWRWLTVIDREFLLWVFSLSLLAWLIWTDVRPYWKARRAPKYPARHREICGEIADCLAELRTLTLSSQMWAVNEKNLSPWQKAQNRAFSKAHEKVDKLVSQIPYDRATAKSAIDYRQLCSIVIGEVFEKGDPRPARQELEAVGPPIFEALHSGKPINRAEVPWPQWIRDTESGTRQ